MLMNYCRINEAAVVGVGTANASLGVGLVLAASQKPTTNFKDKFVVATA